MGNQNIKVVEIDLIERFEVYSAKCWFWGNSKYSSVDWLSV